MNKSTLTAIAAAVVVAIAAIGYFSSDNTSTEMNNVTPAAGEMGGQLDATTQDMDTTYGTTTTTVSDEGMAVDADVDADATVSDEGMAVEGDAAVAADVDAAAETAVDAAAEAEASADEAADAAADAEAAVDADASAEGEVQAQ